MIDNLTKEILLPSGGLFYPPLVSLKPLDYEVFFTQSFPNQNDSVFELYYNIIKNYIISSFPIQEMLISDFYFLWSYFVITDLYHDSFYKQTYICKYCQTKNTITIPFSEIPFKQFSRFEKIRYENKITVREQYTIYIKHRRISENFEFSYLSLKYNPDEELINMFIVYILPIITLIYDEYNKKEISQNNYFDLLCSLSKNDISEILEYSNQIDEEIGIGNDIQFQCQNEDCKQYNIEKIFDNFSNCIISSHSFDHAFLNKHINYVFELARLPIFTIDNITKLPIRISENIQQSLDKIDFQNGALMF